MQWSIHAKTTAGNTIIKAQVPTHVNLDHFNELYIDEKRAIVAKYPNGDPATQGLYATKPGFSYDSESWFTENVQGGPKKTYPFLQYYFYYSRIHFLIQFFL